MRFHTPGEMSSAAISEAHLVARCRRGDPVAWAELVDRFSRYVYAIASQAYRLPPHDAEDVSQEVFARTFEHLDRLRDDEAVRPWIGQLTRRLCVDRLRIAAREQPTEREPEARDAGDVLARLDDALSVHEALRLLPESCREILDRFFCRDQSYQTIEAELGLPAGTIASRISRCLGKLRTKLEGRSPAARPSREG